MDKVIENTKSTYQDYICLFKIGVFYCAYDKDAYVMSYLFNYKMRDKGEEKEVGFPVNSIDKIRERLKQEKINYIIVETKPECKIIEKEDLHNANKYNAIYVKARNHINLKVRLDALNKALVDMLETKEKNFKEVLGIIEEIIYNDDE